MQPKLEALKASALAGNRLNREDGLFLARETGLEELIQAAHDVREARKGKGVSFCAISNAKSGQCAEDCAFCSQSAHFTTQAGVWDFKPMEELLEAAKRAKAGGASAFCLVTSGKYPSDVEFDQILQAAQTIGREVGIDIHVSIGLLSRERLRALKLAGVREMNLNLQTSRNFYPRICSTHTWDERREGVRLALEEGLSVCCGGLFGMGESWEDRVDFAGAVGELGVPSVPVNFLDPIAGTPLARQGLLPAGEALRILAVLRLMLPDAEIRTCGGREKTLGKLQDRMYEAGASATLMGNYLTTQGGSPEEDRKMLAKLGLETRPC